MNKLLFLLSIFFVLNACSSQPEQDENDLPPGIMQPVLSTGAVEGAEWQPVIEKQPMPESMN